MLLEAAQWIETTGLSTHIRESTWTYPIIQSAHVLGLGWFGGLTLVMDLRLAGVLLRGEHVGIVMARLLPWIRWGFAVMAVTGLLLMIATPVTFYGNPFFRAKAVLLVLAGLNVAIFHTTLYPAVDRWGHLATLPVRARWAGIASIVLWTGVIVTGRLVAYNWFQ
jgi:hypothetical protein